jgi:RNA polymerase sigma factor (sigma-70 family)
MPKPGTTDGPKIASLKGMNYESFHSAAEEPKAGAVGICDGSRPHIDHDFFASAYQRGFASTLRILRAMGATMDAAEEVAQAAWSRGWQYREQLLNPEAISSWINTIARNLYRAKIVGEKRFEELLDRPMANRIVLELEAKDLIECCNPRESEMLVLFYIEGYSILEIAKRVRMHPTTVRVRLLRIRQNLRSKLQTASSPRLTARAA